MRLGEEHIFNNKSLTLITKKIMKKKNYLEPTMKFHQLKSGQILDGSPAGVTNGMNNNNTNSSYDGQGRGDYYEDGNWSNDGGWIN